MKINNNKIKNFLLILYSILLLINMKIYYNRYILTMVFFMYLIVALKNIKVKKGLWLIWLTLFLMIYLISSIFNDALSPSIKLLLQMITTFSPIIIFYLEKDNFKNKKILTSFVIVTIYLFLINMYYLSTDIYFARMMANYEYNIPNYSGLALFSGGGYYYIYGVILIAILALNNAIDCTKPMKKIFFFLAYFLLVYLVIKSNFATAFLMLLIGSMILLYFKTLKKFKHKILITFLLITVIVILFALYEEIILYLISILPKDSIISIRLIGMVDDSDSSTFFERMDLMAKSFATIEDYFFFGKAAYYRYDYNAMANEMGLHTEWIDFIAKHGIFISIIFFSFLYKSFKTLYNKYKTTNYSPVIITGIIVLILLGFLNPISNTSCFLMLFTILPVFIERSIINDKTI